MPTVILLDVSLSMTRPVVMPDCAEEYQRRHLATHGINTLLDHCAAHAKLEFISLVVFSSLWDQLAPFTRDYETVRAALNKVVDYDKTCLEAALTGVSGIVLEEWGASTQTQVILITDGSAGVGAGSLKQSLENLEEDGHFPLPFPFLSRLHLVVLAARDDPALETSLPMYERLVALNHSQGGVLLPDGPLGLKSVQQLFTKLAEDQFTLWSGQLVCGHLKCPVSLFPPPMPYDNETFPQKLKDTDFEPIHCKMYKEIEMCGFLDIADVASPPCISRHLCLPIGPVVEETGSGEADCEKDEEEVVEVTKTAALTVLLHGALKVEGMVAIVQVGNDWYGKMFAWADSKKKSNLMLALFPPGSDMIPWLGNLKHLAPIGDFAEPPYGDDDNRTPFPVRPMDRRSYAQNCVVWIKPSGLQADIQKILRHARKLPEKQQHFYKELNRLRRAALSLGFHEILEKVSLLLERECTMLPGNAHPDAALQLSHASSALRAEAALEHGSNIAPLRTNFSGD